MKDDRENGNEDEVIELENVDLADEMLRDRYALTRDVQNIADSNLVKTHQSKSVSQLMDDLAYGVKAKFQLNTIDKLEEIGKKMVECRGNVKRAAHFFKMDVQELQALIRTEPILHAYWTAAFEGLKTLVDEKVIERIEGGADEDKDILKMVFAKLYSGRRQGGYNPNEFGTLGYTDPVAQAQQEHIAKELAEESRKTTVMISFGNKLVEVNEDQTVEGALIDSFIDADEEEESED